MFKRKIEKRLKEYYQTPEAPILVVNGARQVGKSFIIRQTAKCYFRNYIEINLQADSDGERLFENINSTRMFYLQLSALYGDKLNNAEDTIVFLDEIQVYPHLLTLLKSLKMEAKFRYIVSGSLLGLTLQHTFIPMGSIEEVRMYPMDFEEFLVASGTGKDVIDYLRGCFENREQVDLGIHKVIMEKFKEYLLSGGLPDSVKELLENRNILKMRTVQNQIFGFYKDDASKYDLEHNLKIRNIYDSLSSYMENKVKRIQFKKLEGIRNANMQRYQDEFNYLIYSGCTLDVKAVSNPVFPLNSSSTKNLIKLYYNDVGILSEILFKNNISAILNKDAEINLGSVYETACAMELKAHGHDLYYFDSKKTGEVDFLLNDYDSLSILPIEIKSGRDWNNFRAIIKLVKEPYNLKEGYVLSNSPVIQEKERLVYYPVYMVMFV